MDHEDDQTSKIFFLSANTFDYSHSIAVCLYVFFSIFYYGFLILSELKKSITDMSTIPEIH